MVIKQGGLKSKTQPQLCQWKKACYHLSDDAFQTMKDIAEDDGLQNVDPKAISLNLLTTRTMEGLLQTPKAQSLFLHIFARYGCSPPATSNTLILLFLSLFHPPFIRLIILRDWSTFSSRMFFFFRRGVLPITGHATANYFFLRC